MKTSSEVFLLISQHELVFYSRLPLMRYNFDMTEMEVFVLADETLKKVIDQIKDDQWDMELPDTLTGRQS